MKKTNSLFPDLDRIKRLKSTIKELKKLQKKECHTIYKNIIRDFQYQLKELINRDKKEVKPITKP